MMFKTRSLLLLAVFCIGAVAVGAQTPRTAPDESWISISGTAVATERGAFTLDYGEGKITVEMDDWDWYERDYELLEGDRVTVYGRVDDNVFASDTIEASSVYVEEMGTYFYESAADEEEGDYFDYWLTDNDAVVRMGYGTLRGVVTRVNGREFTVDSGLREITVDTRELGYDPTDDVGYQQIDVGDYVSVTGDFDSTFWEGRQLIANSVVTLYED